MYKVNWNGKKGTINIENAEKKEATPSISEETLEIAYFSLITWPKSIIITVRIVL